MAMLGTVIIETQFTGPVKIDIASGSGEPSRLFQILKPKATIITTFGEQVYAPYGRPDIRKRSLYQSGAVMGLVALALLFVLVLKK